MGIKYEKKWEETSQGDEALTFLNDTDYRKGELSSAGV